jgi:hypothetical protein
MFDRNENPINEKRMFGGKIQISMGILIVQR